MIDDSSDDDDDDDDDDDEEEESSISAPPPIPVPQIPAAPEEAGEDDDEDGGGDDNFQTQGPEMFVDTQPQNATALSDDDDDDDDDEEADACCGNPELAGATQEDRNDSSESGSKSSENDAFRTQLPTPPSQSQPQSQSQSQSSDEGKSDMHPPATQPLQHPFRNADSERASVGGDGDKANHSECISQLHQSTQHSQESVAASVNRQESGGKGSRESKSAAKKEAPNSGEKRKADVAIPIDSRNLGALARMDVNIVQAPLSPKNAKPKPEKQAKKKRPNLKSWLSANLV
jgi:hypothetical protein